MARQNIKWEAASLEQATTGDASTLENAKAQFLLYYIALDASVNVFSTAKQGWYLAACRVMATYAPEVYDDQRPYVNSVEDHELDLEQIELGLKHYCPEGYTYKVTESGFGYYKD